VSAFEAYCDIEGSIKGTVLIEEPMARHTSFRIGGPASLYIECACLSDINRSLEVLKAHSLPWLIVGKGSNLLVSDEGYKGAILTLGQEFKYFSFPDESQGERQLIAGAGVMLSNLVQDAFRDGYSGLEFCVGIPGTFGGALYMNAGSSTEWMGSIVDSITVLRPEQGLVLYEGRDLPWQYRKSGIPMGEVIVEGRLRVKKGHLSSIRAKMEGSLKRRRKSQPLNVPSAGSVFQNPEGISAGQMIESLGLKGFSVGGARVSDVHANFIVNNGQATAADVVALVIYIRERIKEEYGQELQPEIRFVGFS